MFTLHDIAKACNGQLISGQKEMRVSGVSCDSRTLQAGELFVALRGKRFDGHAFLKEVFQKGAACALVDRKPDSAFPVVVVDDTLKSLQRLARFYRALFSIPVVAVTGSAGKTTTKECIGILLSEVFRVRVGFGNWNNHIGVPLNIFKLSADDQCLVLELGANHTGEIAALAKMAQPTVGVITEICPVHLEGFGSLEGIYRAKLELADFLDGSGGTIIANGDDPELVARLKGRKSSLITFGRNKDCDYVLNHVATRNGLIYFKVNGKYEFRLRGHGAFNAINALAAIATAGYFNLDLESLSEAWWMFPSIEGRFRLDRLELRDIQIIDDSYNANPKSFERAVESFCELVGDRRKIVVVGDMLELGNQSRLYHEALGKLLANRGIDQVIGVGSLSRFTLEAFAGASSETRTDHFEDPEAAGKFLFSILQEGDAILIKGSHGMRLDKVKPYLQEHFKTTTAFV